MKIYKLDIFDGELDTTIDYYSNIEAANKAYNDVLNKVLKDVVDRWGEDNIDVKEKTYNNFKCSVIRGTNKVYFATNVGLEMINAKDEYIPENEESNHEQLELELHADGVKEVPLGDDEKMLGALRVKEITQA